jgi:elongation factor Ts
MQITASMVKELRERTGAGMMECKKALVDTGGDIEAAVEHMRKSGQAKADKKAGRVAAEGLVAVAVSEDGTRGALVEVNCETDFVAKEEAFRRFAQTVAERALGEDVSDVVALGELAAGDGQSIDERRRELIAKIGENMSLRRAVVVHSVGGRVGAYLHGGRIGVLVDVAGGDDVVAKDIAMHVAASQPLAVSADGLPGEALAKEEEILKAQVAESGKPPEIQEKMIAGRLNKYLKEVTLLGQPFVKDPDQTVQKYLDAAGASVASFVRFGVGEGIEKRTENFAEEVMAQVRGA